MERKSLDMFLITGCPRSGTSYMAELLNKHSIDVGDEKHAKDGIVSCWFAVDTKIVQPWSLDGNVFSNYKFNTILHQVRHPLECISSCVTALHNKSWNYFSHFVPLNTDNLLYKSMLLWYYWNIKCEEISTWTFKVEAINDVYEELSLRIGHPRLLKKEVINSLRRNVNSYGAHKKYEWSDLEQIDKSLTYRIKNLGKKYGYND